MDRSSRRVGVAARRAARIADRASAGEPLLQARLDRRPLPGEDAVERGVAVRAVGHDRVVAQDALEGRADPQQGRPRPLVAGMGLELDPFGVERLERVGQLEQLGLAVRAGALQCRCAIQVQPISRRRCSGVIVM